MSRRQHGHWLFGLLAALLLSACAPTTIPELHQGPHEVIELQVEGNYKEVYRRVLFGSRQEYDAVQGDIFEDLRSAQIIWGISSDFVVVHVRIDYLTEARSSVMITYWPKVIGWKIRAEQCAAWAKSGSGELPR